MMSSGLFPSPAAALVASVLLLLVLLPRPVPARPDDLLRPRAGLVAAEVVTTGRGATLPHLALNHPRPKPSDMVRPRVERCLRPDQRRNRATLDLAAYDWPGSRSAREHQLCLFAIFRALGDRDAVQEWVRRVIAPHARPDCPARWNIEEGSRLGAVAVNVWRSRHATPLFVDVLDRAALWSDDLRTPVHSRLSTTFDTSGRPVVVKYEAFTIGDRYGLERCP